MLNRSRPETITTDLKIKGLGEVFSVSVTYKNLTEDQRIELMNTKKADDTTYTVAEYLERAITKFNTTDAPTAKQFEAMENEWPGILVAIMLGFGDARRVNLEKN